MPNVIEIQVRADDKASTDFTKSAKKLADTAGKAGDQAGEEFSKEFAASLKAGAKDAENAGQDAGKGYGNAYVDGTNGVIRGGFGVIKGELEEVKSDSDAAGKDAGKALADGLENGAKGVNVASSLKGDLSKVESEARSSGKAAGDALGDGLKDGAKSGESKLDSAVEGMGDGIVDAMSGIGQDGGAGLIDGLSGAVSGKGGIVGSLLGGAVALGLKEALDREQSQANFAASMGISSADAAEAGRVAGAVYAQGWGESRDDLMNIAGEVATQFNMSVNDVNFQPLVTKAAQLKQIYGVETTEAVRAVGQMIKTGLVPDAQTGFDVLSAGFQGGADQAGDLLETVTEYGTQFRKLGLDGGDAMTLIQQGLQGGARDADIVADSLKELSIRAVDGSKTTTDAFNSLHLNADQTAEAFARGGESARGALDTVLDRLRAIQDPVERNRVGVELFGTQWEDMGGAINALDLGPANETLNGLKGNLDDAAAKASGTWSFSFGQMANNFTNTMTSMDGTSSGFTSSLGQKTVAWLGSMFNFSGGTQQAAGNVEGALGGVQGAANQTTGAINNIPTQHGTNVWVDPGNSWDVINSVKGWLSGLKDKSVAVNVGVTGVQAGIEAFFGRFAHGGVVGRAASGGPRSNQVLVGEQGPEIVDLAPGSMVHPAGQSKAMLKDWLHGYAGGGVVQAEDGSWVPSSFYDNPGMLQSKTERDRLQAAGGAMVVRNGRALWLNPGEQQQAGDKLAVAGKTPAAAPMQNSVRRSNTGSSGGGTGGRSGDVTLNFSGRTDSAFATAFMNLLRSGDIQIQANNIQGL